MPLFPSLLLRYEMSSYEEFPNVFLFLPFSSLFFGPWPLVCSHFSSFAFVGKQCSLCTILFLLFALNYLGRRLLTYNMSLEGRKSNLRRNCHLQRGGKWKETTTNFFFFSRESRVRVRPPKKE